MGSSLLIDGLNLVTLLDALPLLAAETSRLAGLLNNIWLGLQVAAGLGFVIFVHELGHFLAAKTFGVRCDKFYVGFDVPISIGPIKLPRTLGKFQYGETEYGIGIIPLGGYVKMLGQDDDPRKAEEEAERTRLEGGGEDAPLDPRSYPAKPVWQRMIIISAGVVMNLIFAVILAGIAFRFGVPYTPTIAGSTYGGGPAWAAKIEPGDQVVRVGKMNNDNPDLRYDDFAMAVVMGGFESKNADLPIAVKRGEERLELTAKPTPLYSPDKDFFRIGLNQPTIPQISSPPYRDESFLGSVKPDLQDGDIVTAVDGVPLEVDSRFGVVLGSTLTAALQANWESPVTLTIQRKSKTEKGVEASEETVSVGLPPVPVNSLGLGFAPGPVTDILQGSLAAQAGFVSGDVIKTVNGETVVNALELPSIVARLAGKPVTFGVQRGIAIQNAVAGETDPNSLVELEIAEAPKASFDPISPLAGELTLGGVGLAMEVSNLIASVDETIVGSDCPIRVGDELKLIQWLPAEEDKEEVIKLYGEADLEPLAITDTFNVASLYGYLQQIPVGSKIRCVVSQPQQDGDTNASQMSDSIEITTNYAEGWYWHQRGIMLTMMSRTHQTDDLVAAARLGFWETSRRFSEVLNFLKLLVTGKVGSKGLGGPGRIAYAAASEASVGVPRLMLFLTLLSANLAILNFLPIPALDGGHMVFLIAEAIRGKPVSEALQIRLTMIGVLGLLSLMAFVIVKDILWFI